MTLQELSKEQVHELKERYLMKLADEGTFAEVVNVDYDEPSYEDLANADEIVPDCVIEREYEDICFVEDDFFCTARNSKKPVLDGIKSKILEFDVFID